MISSQVGSDAKTLDAESKTSPSDFGFLLDDCWCLFGMVVGCLVPNLFNIKLRLEAETCTLLQCSIKQNSNNELVHVCTA